MSFFHIFLCPTRNAASDLHQTSLQLWAHPEPRWDSSGQPPLLQPAGLQRDPNQPRLHHRRNEEPWNYRRDFALPVQHHNAFSQFPTLLQKSELGGLPLGIHQLLRHVRTAEWLWRFDRHRRTGMCKQCIALLTYFSASSKGVFTRGLGKNQFDDIYHDNSFGDTCIDVLNPDNIDCSIQIYLNLPKENQQEFE